MKDKPLKERIREILENFSRSSDEGECPYCPAGSGDCEKCPKMIKALQAILTEIKKGLPERKAIIDITKKMCFNLEYPTDCLYNKPNPNGATCSMQDRGIPKEKCSDYKDMQVEYETFEQWNAYHDEMEKLLE